MSADVVSNPHAVTPGESKSARKKKGKAEAAIAVAPSSERASSDAGAGSSDPAAKINGVEGSTENAYVKELQKNIRNTNKKLSAMQKVDAIIEANPNVSLDELVSTRKINSDQKAAALKKPGLQAQLAQFEEQLAQYKKFDQEYQHKAALERQILQQAHSEELEKLRDVVKAEVAIESKKDFKEKILTLSRFLRAAAARRQLEDDDSDLTKAFEGALLLVYGGDAGAVAAAEKLIDGSSDHVPSTEGAVLSVTYGQVKQAALDEAPFAAEEAWVEEVAQAQPTAPEDEPSSNISSDPTITNAGLTELNTGISSVNGSSTLDTPSILPTASVGAGNSAAEDQWDKAPSGSDDPLAESYEIIPRPTAETETPAAAAPVNSVQSWADDSAEQAAAVEAVNPKADDTFQQVQHHRGRGRGGVEGRGGGSFRGGRGRGGDGHRGNRGRGGRGGGGFRGERGGGPRGHFRGGRGDSQQPSQ